MEFWNSLLTEKSWQILCNLQKENFRFIVVGGWATYLWTKQHKSKDIDIIIPDFKTLAALKQKYDLIKNDRLKKYEIKKQEIDIDIYVPHYSAIVPPVESILNETTKVEGFEVIKPEVLLLLKQSAELDRKDSIKGQKDRIDIVTLLCNTAIDFAKYKELLTIHHLSHFRQRLREIIMTFKDLKHININAKDYAKVKRELLEKI